MTEQQSERAVVALEKIAGAMGDMRDAQRIAIERQQSLPQVDFPKAFEKIIDLFPDKRERNGGVR